MASSSGDSSSVLLSRRSALSGSCPGWPGASTAPPSDAFFLFPKRDSLSTKQIVFAATSSPCVGPATAAVVTMSAVIVVVSVEVDGP
jgi:hypothetical protein